MSDRIAEQVDAAGRARMIAELRRLSARELAPAVERREPARAGEELCDLCGGGIPADHRHLIHVEQRTIACVCETCRALLAGDSPFRPVGTRTLWLDGFDLGDERWASFGIPIGLAFFLTTKGRAVAFYPSPAGATESELHLGSWSDLVEANPVLAGLEPDVEGLIVNRLADPPRHAIAPIDDCYRLVGIVKANWEGISGGGGLEQAVAGFFDELRERGSA